MYYFYHYCIKFDEEVLPGIVSERYLSGVWTTDYKVKDAATYIQLRLDLVNDMNNPMIDLDDCVITSLSLLHVSEDGSWLL